MHGWNYGQSAIVTTVGHERDHQGRAESTSCLPVRSPSCRSKDAAPRSCGPSERARPSASSRCPMTPSTPSWNSASTCISATSAVIGARRAYPLGFFVRARFIAERLALVGDAAHAHSSDRRPGAQ